MTNTFQSRSPDPSGPAVDILPVAQNDSVNLAKVARAFQVERGGLVSSVTERSQSRAVGVADHPILPVATSRANTGAHTATGIHALVIT